MNYTQEQLLKIFKNLPEEVKDAIVSVDTADAIKNIGDKYKLHIDQMGVLASLTGGVMLGTLKPHDFLSNIQGKLNISLETAGEIVKDINTAIFFPIRQQLKVIHNLERSSEEKYRPEPAPLVEPAMPLGNPDPNIKETTPAPTNNSAVIINQPVPEKREAGEKIFTDKMAKLFNIPKEEVAKTNIPTEKKDNDLTNKPIHHDPYQEPVE